MLAPDNPFEVRPVEPADGAAVLELLAASMGWQPDEQLDRFVDWKHKQSPFGPSPGWVAVDQGQVVGFRTFLRWEFEHVGGAVLRAVRAVDTATLPSHQGRGVFRGLTLTALADLEADGVDLVFNTPNAQSRPGYLKMGWTEVGRLPVWVRPTSPTAVLRMTAARVPAERWSAPARAGLPAAEVLASERLAGLLRTIPPGDRLHTRRTAEYLRWRYGFEPLAYRALTVSSDVAEGVAVFRLRRRGRALECALCDVLVPAGDRSTERSLVRSVVRSSGADYIIRLGATPMWRSGFVPLPRQGPTLTWRPLRSAPPGPSLDHWNLTLGDIELF